MDIITLLEAALLGVVEGLTEFIPVSSTGHLILLVDILGFKAPPGKTFEIIIQLGAILAVCWLYRQRLLQVTCGLVTEKSSQRFAGILLIAFLPAAVLGVLFHGFIKEVLFSPTVVSVNLVIGGFLILLIEKKAPRPIYKDIDRLPFKTALAIGFAQAVAMIPGTSRSGATIMGSLLLKVDRKTATEFSFFLAIPTMLSATLYDIYKNLDVLSFDNVPVIATGFITAFLCALLVVQTVIRFISTHGFAPFAYYRIALGVVMLGLLYG